MHKFRAGPTQKKTLTGVANANVLCKSDMEYIQNVHLGKIYINCVIIISAEQENLVNLVMFWGCMFI